ncbi:CLUMA_CG011358, isoform B [Clunio marinus]|uniref:CLUMA_CG011358, isoform B n=1 Tax=Clunio marinus TaxID=568069 RepID=A0A1J1ICQ8_9DIPT|nr:CLUMA_CG011358, isoform B [Clunio marinus]
MAPPRQQVQVADKGYGEHFRYDPKFRGPLSQRSCTDVICLLFFFVFLIAFGFAGYYAQREGDLNRLLVPRDSEGKQCGEDSEVLDKKFLLFFDLAKCADPLVPLNGCPTTQTCVKQCPTTNFVHSKQACQQNFQTYKEKLICTRNVAMKDIRNCDDVEKWIEKEQCAKWYLKSEPFFNLCLSELLPLNYECSAKMFNENRGRYQRDMFNLDLSKSSDMKCERVDPAKKRMLKEKFEIAESFLGRFIGNILKHFHFSEEKDVLGMGQSIVEDTVNTWPVLAVGFVISAFCSLIIIAIMRWVAGPIVWLSIVGVIALLSVGE